MKKVVAVVGGGHNGLVLACYLAMEGHKVKVFEKRSVLGGCCSTDETTFPGHKISSAAYVNSLFLPRIVRELELRKYGYKVLPRNPSSFTPLPDGQYLFLGNNREENKKEIAKFSKADAEAYERYEKALERIGRFTQRMLTITPPNWPPRSFLDFASDAATVSYIFVKLLLLGPVAMWRLYKLTTQDARTFLDSWFESDALKATLLTDATIGAMDFSGYVLLHHVMCGIWGYQRGGMGAIANALAKAAGNMGVEIHVNKPVKEILVSSGKACGVLLENGERVEADVVVSNADMKLTLTKLVPQFTLTYGFLDKIKKLDSNSAVMKVNLTLSDLPDFYCMPGTELGPQHMGTIHISPSVEYLERAAKEGNRGIPSVEPMLELTIPSSVDRTVAPPGRHTANIFVQYTPQLKEGSWDDVVDFPDKRNEMIAAILPKKGEYLRKHLYFEVNIMNALREYISNIDSIITGVQILSPLDLEREFSLSNGNIFHIGMGLGQLFHRRPLPGYADYRTPIEGLYLCGAGTHPGGGVTGANGYNAAREISKDLESL